MTGGPVVYALDGIPLGTRDDFGCVWWVQKTTGWYDAPEPRNEREPRPGAHGDFSSPVWRSARVITLSGQTRCPNVRFRQAAQERFAALCVDPDRLYPLLVTRDDGFAQSVDVHLDARPDVITMNERWFGWRLQVAAPDPLKYGPWGVAETPLPDGGTGGLDMSAPGATYGTGADYGPASSAGTATVITTGKARTGGLFEIVGPVPEPIITVGSIRMVYAGEVPAGSSVWINTGQFAALGIPARSASQGGQDRTDRLSVVGGWPVFPPGATSVAFASASSSPLTMLRVHYRSGWW